MGGRQRPVPAGAATLLRAPTALATAPRTSPTWPAPGTLTHNGNADNHQHWTQVACGHEVQINETLTGTGPLGGSDPIKTGSIYNFRNLNAQQSRTYERLVKGVWHEMEIRTIGQQYTVLVDGRMINQFDNSIPKIASRNGDPATSRASSRAATSACRPTAATTASPTARSRSRRSRRPSIPVNTVAPTVTGTGFVGQNLTCNQGTWTPAPGITYSRKLVPLEQDRCRRNPHFRAPSQIDLGSFSTPADPAGTYGNQDLTWLDSLLVDEDGNSTYTPTAADVGKVIHCALVADNGGATVWKTAIGAGDPGGRHDAAVGGTVPATLSLDARRPGVVRRRSRPASRVTTTPRTTATVDLVGRRRDAERLRPRHDGHRPPGQRHGRPDAAAAGPRRRTARSRRSAAAPTRRTC